MQTRINRICIYPKDVQQLTGKSYRHAISYLQQVRQHFNKEERQFVSLSEFCKYSGLPIEEVKAYLSLSDGQNHENR